MQAIRTSRKDKPERAQEHLAHADALSRLRGHSDGIMSRKSIDRKAAARALEDANRELRRPHRTANEGEREQDRKV